MYAVILFKRDEVETVLVVDDKKQAIDQGTLLASRHSFFDSDGDEKIERVEDELDKNEWFESDFHPEGGFGVQIKRAFRP